jgi:hypothetical protein
VQQFDSEADPNNAEIMSTILESSSLVTNYWAASEFDGVPGMREAF